MESFSYRSDRKAFSLREFYKLQRHLGREHLKSLHPDWELFRLLSPEDVEIDLAFNRYREYLRDLAAYMMESSDVDIQSLSEVLESGKTVFTLADFSEDLFESHDQFSPLPLSDMIRHDEDVYASQQRRLPSTIFKALDRESGRHYWFQYDRDFHLQAPEGGIFEVDGDFEVLPSVETVSVSPESKAFYEIYGEHLNVFAIQQVFQEYAEEQGKALKQLVIPNVAHVKTPLFAVVYEDNTTQWMTLDLSLFQSRWWARENAPKSLQQWLRDKENHHNRAMIEKSAELSDDGEVELELSMLGENFSVVIRAHEKSFVLREGNHQLTDEQRQLVQILLKRFTSRLSSQEQFVGLSPAKKLQMLVAYVARSTSQRRFAHVVPVGVDFFGEPRLEVLSSSPQELEFWVRAGAPFRCRVIKDDQGKIDFQLEGGDSALQEDLRSFTHRLAKKCTNNLPLMARFLSHEGLSPWSMDCAVMGVQRKALRNRSQEGQEGRVSAELMEKVHQTQDRLEGIMDPVEQLQRFLEEGMVPLAPIRLPSAEKKDAKYFSQRVSMERLVDILEAGESYGQLLSFRIPDDWAFVAEPVCVRQGFQLQGLTDDQLLHCWRKRSADGSQRWYLEKRGEFIELGDCIRPYDQDEVSMVEPKLYQLRSGIPRPEVQRILGMSTDYHQFYAALQSWVQQRYSDYNRLNYELDLLDIGLPGETGPMIKVTQYPDTDREKVEYYSCARMIQ